MDAQPKTVPASRFQRLAVATGAVVLAGLLVALWLWIDQARLYQSRAAIRTARTSPSFIETEFEVFRSPTILHEVIRQLDLAGTFSRRFHAGGKLTVDETYQILLHRLKLQGQPTEVIDLTVASEQSDEAAAIANAVALEYLRYTRDALNQRYARGVQYLEDELRKADRAPDRGDRIPILNQQLQDLRREHLAQTNLVQVIETATPAAERRWWQKPSWLSGVLDDQPWRRLFN